MNKLGTGLNSIGDGVQKLMDQDSPAEAPPPQPEPSTSPTQGHEPSALPAANYNHVKPKVAEVQDLLNRLGYGVGTVDGIYGNNTKAAIQTFELDRNLPPYGVVTDQLIARLEQAAQSLPQQASPAVAPAQPQAYDSPSPAAPSQADDVQQVRDAQRMLNQLGYDAGVVDGQFGPKTRLAIRDYQLERNLPTDGKVTPQLLSSLSQELSTPVATGSTTSPSGPPLPGGAIAQPPDGGLVAPALGGGLVTHESEPVPAAGGPASAASEDYASLAAAHRLRLAHGLPVVAGSRHSVLTDDEIASISKFFAFVELGLDASLIESNPACWARVHLPKHLADRYVATGTEALNSQKHMFIANELVAWKGANEFEMNRTKDAFLAEQAGNLKAKAVSLPLEVMAIDEMALPQYDTQAGGFDLRLRDINGHGATFDTLASYRGLSAPYMSCEPKKFLYSPPAAKLPEIWTMDMARAEEVISRLNERKVYIAISLRFQEMPLARIEDEHRPSKRRPVWSEITSLAVYEDPDLERLIERLPFESASRPVVLSGVPETAPAPASVPMDEESLALLMLRDHGDVLDAEAWRLLMVRQAEEDALYYDRRRDPRTGARLYNTETDRFDETYVPFFPDGFKASFHTRFPEEQLALFKEWATFKASNLPSQLTMEVSVLRSGSQPAMVKLPLADDGDSAKLVGALAAKGYSADQILRPDRRPSGVGRRFDLDMLGGPGKSRVPALILPNVASNFVPSWQAEEQGLLGGPNVFEVTLESGRSKLVAIDGGSETLALDATPRRLTVRKRDTGEILLEKQFDVEALDPNRLESETLPVEAPAIPWLSAETVDLLVVKHQPETVSDEDYRQMLIARWEYEATIPPEKGEPDWGRFFVPGKPKPGEDGFAELLPRFKDWTIKRAAALPERLRLHYRQVRFHDGKPISAEAPYNPRRGNPNEVSFAINNCRTGTRSYPALVPACDFLEHVGSNAPDIHPFGLGYTLAGPRISCATALSDHRDPYCKAREAQYDKDERHGIEVEPGFRDIFVYDREIFFPGTESELKSLSRSSLSMVLEIAVTGVSVRQAPMPEPFTEARKRVEAFREGLGLGGSNWAGANEPAPTGTYFVYDAKLLSAALVERKSHDMVAELKLEEARTVDLDALELPDVATGMPDAPFGPDVVGLRLGMTFEEADRIIRSHMKVGRVLRHDRALDPSAITGDFAQFTSSRIYVREDGGEFIILYDEPPAAPNVVLAITRQINIPHGAMAPSAALQQLRGKYGKEDWSGDRGLVGWGEGLRETTPHDSRTHKCLPATANRSPRDWVEEDGAPTSWHPGGGSAVPVMTMYGDIRGRTCGAVLGMQLDMGGAQAKEDRLVLQLTDPNLQWSLYEESKRLIKAGEAMLGDRSAAPELKL